MLWMSEFSVGSYTCDAGNGFEHFECTLPWEGCLLLFYSVSISIIDSNIVNMAYI